MTLYETTLNIFFCIILKNEFSRIARNFDNNTESCVADIKTHSEVIIIKWSAIAGSQKKEATTDLCVCNIYFMTMVFVKNYWEKGLLNKQCGTTG